MSVASETIDLMKKQHGSGSKKLAAGQVTPQDLARLVQTGSEGAWRIGYYATWRSGDIARKDSLWDSTAIDDLNEIEEDLEGLRYLSLDFYYDRDDFGEHLEVNFRSGQLDLRWSGALGREHARRVEDVWNALPKRARLSDERLFTVTSVIYALLLPFGIYLIVRPSTWLIVGAYAFTAFALLLTYGRRRLFVAARADAQPFITSRPTSAFQQPGFLLMLCLTIVSLAVAGASFIRDLVAG